MWNVSFYFYSAITFRFYTNVAIFISLLCVYLCALEYTFILSKKKKKNVTIVTCNVTLYIKPHMETLNMKSRKTPKVVN